VNAEYSEEETFKTHTDSRPFGWFCCLFLV